MPACRLYWRHWPKGALSSVLEPHAPHVWLVINAFTPDPRECSGNRSQAAAKRCERPTSGLREYVGSRSQTSPWQLSSIIPYLGCGSLVVGQSLHRKSKSAPSSFTTFLFTYVMSYRSFRKPILASMPKACPSSILQWIDR